MKNEFLSSWHFDIGSFDLRSFLCSGPSILYQTNPDDESMLGEPIDWRIERRPSNKLAKMMLEQDISALLVYMQYTGSGDEYSVIGDSQYDFKNYLACFGEDNSVLGEEARLPVSGKKWARDDRLINVLEIETCSLGFHIAIHEETICITVAYFIGGSERYGDSIEFPQKTGMPEVLMGMYRHVCRYVIGRKKR